ncbi:hypothetical protein CHARACLAT_024167 [Characodon lateralis]|uniref:Uncharacterized protein n=1 Tax=Characodon lateralis TaxID=208331 RepID=A0ABU7ELU8_9TELE|nr:hypothetical protein [Characodon lateralis]
MHQHTVTFRPQSPMLFAQHFFLPRTPGLSACVSPRFNFLRCAFNHTFCSGPRWSTVRSPTGHGPVTHTEFTVEDFSSPAVLEAACRLKPQSGTGLLRTGTPVIRLEGPKKCLS